MAGISLRLLGPADEDVVRALATYDGPGDLEALLERLAELARERGDEDNAAASALYRRAGGTPHRDVMWTFSYADD